MRPAISFVMPHFNSSDKVANAINSIRNQTFQDFELIIVDDGSEGLHKSNLLEILEKFSDHRIRVYLNPHRGIPFARNYGIEKATADIIAHQDADDLSLPDRAEKALAAFDDSTDIVYHGIYRNAWDKQFNCITRDYIPALPYDLERLLQEQYISGVSFFRKSIWQKKPFRISTGFAYDWMMYLDWALSGFKFKNLDIGLYEYIRQENSASFQYAKDGRRQESITKIKEILKNEYGIPN